MKSIFTVLIAFVHVFVFGQSHKKALFIGNSYTYYNDLPALTAQVANSMGDTLDVDSSTPGGTTFSYHSTYAATQEKIAQGGWDFVVLQEQSQLPALPIETVESDSYPYAAKLNDSIVAYSPCAETMFYMTWGRENGDADNCDFWPPVCTYEGMDDLLRERYVAMAEMNDAVVSPVGVVRRSIRENYPDIQLYATDGSHPSPEGSYAAAVCFYTCMFRRDPLLISFDYSIDNTTEEIIKQTVHDVVFENMAEWFITAYDPIASLEIENVSGSTYMFTNTSSNAESFTIYNSAESTTTDFTENSFTHTFPGMGTYEICLHAFHCALEDVTCYTIVNGVLTDGSLSAAEFLIYPNPAEEYLMITPGRSFENYTVRIFDSNGALKLFKNCRSNESLNISEFSSGIYLIEVSYSEMLLRKKWLKQ